MHKYDNMPIKDCVYVSIEEWSPDFFSGFFFPIA